jgi:hypothetical protein
MSTRRAALRRRAPRRAPRRSRARFNLRSVDRRVEVRARDSIDAPRFDRRVEGSIARAGDRTRAHTSTRDTVRLERREGALEDAGVVGDDREARARTREDGRRRGIDRDAARR